MNSAQAQLGAVLAEGGEELADLLARTESRLADVAGAQGPELSRHAEGILAAGGKRLRPLLVFLSGGGEPALPAAVAVELLHMATLVHDDVLDRAQLRRGQPTVFASGGAGAATVTEPTVTRARRRSQRCALIFDTVSSLPIASPAR